MSGFYIIIIFFCLLREKKVEKIEKLSTIMLKCSERRENDEKVDD
jgi:hypothetical protein